MKSNSNIDLSFTKLRLRPIFVYIFFVLFLIIAATYTSQSPVYAACITFGFGCEREATICKDSFGNTCTREGFFGCTCTKQWVEGSTGLCSRDIQGCFSGTPICPGGERPYGSCGGSDVSPTPVVPTNNNTTYDWGGSQCQIYQWQNHCNADCGDSRDAAACFPGNVVPANCCTASCGPTCPGTYCPHIQSTTQFRRLDGNQCNDLPLNSCTSSDNTSYAVDPGSCGWVGAMASNPCGNPADRSINRWYISQYQCIENQSCPTGICGGSTCCRNCESCGNLIIKGNVLERTGYDVGGAFAYHTPLQSFRNLRVGGDLSQSDHPLCGDMTCTIDSINHYTCTVSLPDGCSRTGSVDIVVQGDGYDNHTESVTYTNVLQGGATIDKNLSLVYQAPTNESPGNWTQVKGASYVPRGSGATTKTIMNVMPIAPTRYDTNDAVPSLTNYAFNTGTDANGAVTTNAFLGNYTKYSVDRDWHIDGYPMASRDVTSVYLQYVTKRKLTTYVANSYPRGSVILVPGGTTIPAITDLSFTGAVADGGVLFLVGTSGAPGTVTLGGNITTSTAVGIIAGGITVSPTVSEIDGVFAANTFDTGAAPNQGLKIVGNLSVVGSLANSFTNNRKWQDTSRPSVYVQYDIGRQLGLLKNLSIATSTSQQEE